jgi:hypothetical protein
MKNTIVISFSILIVVFIIGIIGFSFFTKRLTLSKELKESAAMTQEETRSGNVKVNDMGALETDLKLQITSPSDQSTVTSSYIMLRGKTVSEQKYL